MLPLGVPAVHRFAYLADGDLEAGVRVPVSAIGTGISLGRI